MPKYDNSEYLKAVAERGYATEQPLYKAPVTQPTQSAQVTQSSATPIGTANNSITKAISDRLNSFKPVETTPKVDPIMANIKANPTYQPVSQPTQAPTGTVVAMPPQFTPQQLLAQYMANFKPTVTKDQYMTNATNLANTTAGLRYDAQADDLKNRVASIVAGLNTRVKAVPNTYNQTYQNNEQNTYNALQDAKNSLIQRGMGNSGVLDSAIERTNLLGAQAKQGIDMQRINDVNALNDQINTNQSTLNDSLSGIARDKGAFISEQIQNADKTYEDNYRTDMQNYIANIQGESRIAQGDKQLTQQMDIAKMGNATENKKIDVQADQFGKTFGEQSRQFNINDAKDRDQFAATMGFKKEELTGVNKRFYDQMINDNMNESNKQKQAWDIFNKQYSLDEKTLGETIRAHQAQEGYQNKALAQEATLTYAKISSENYQAGLNVQVARENFNLAKAKFDDEQSLYGGIPKGMWNTYAQINDGIDGATYKVLEQVKAGTITGEEAKRTIGNMVLTSPLSKVGDGGWASAKMKMVDEVFGKNQQLVNPTTNKTSFYDSLSNKPMFTSRNDLTSLPSFNNALTNIIPKTSTATNAYINSQPNPYQVK